MLEALVISHTQQHDITIKTGINAAFHCMV